MTTERSRADENPVDADGGPPKPARHFWGRRHERPAKRVWVQNVDVSVSILLARLDALAARRRVTQQQRLHKLASPRRNVELYQRLSAENEIDDHVRELLGRARNAAHRLEPAPNRIVNWWGGRLIEAAYQNLHAAEALMAELYDWDELQSEIPEAVSRLEAGLRRDDPRRQAAYALRDTPLRTMPLAEARAELSKAIDVGHAAADREHSRLRSFRNAVIVASILIGLLVIAFATYVAFNPAQVPLCFTPANAEGEPATWVCPTGEYEWNADTPTVHGPTKPEDILVVGLLGVLGGAFSAAIAIKGLTGTSTPYDVPLALAALKLPLGALTAIGSLIALQGDFVPGLSELDSQGQILAYALVFGYAQQLVSGMLDRRARSLLDTAPGKDKDVQHVPAATKSK